MVTETIAAVPGDNKGLSFSHLQRVLKLLDWVAPIGCGVKDNWGEFVSTLLAGTYLAPPCHLDA
ncbi:MAG: hypothetical protein NZ899_14735 [Thermoguttaceae bacterium]|nr:hypothetical protein [Thermoguttaceae bacterium]MDW8078223.1 hypothetical protein [Thermoguttaceae bacterium]